MTEEGDPEAVPVPVPVPAARGEDEAQEDEGPAEGSGRRPGEAGAEPWWSSRTFFHLLSGKRVPAGKRWFLPLKNHSNDPGA